MKQLLSSIKHLSRTEMKMLKGGGAAHASNCGGYTTYGCMMKCQRLNAISWECTPTACVCFE